MTIATKTPKICWICGKIVYLEECKVDASGLPVHESCYVAKVRLVTEQQVSGKQKHAA
jgi:hypothetical protein